MHEIAQNKGISLNNLAIQCCEYALKNLENKFKLCKKTLIFSKKYFVDVLTYICEY